MAVLNGNAQTFTALRSSSTTSNEFHPGGGLTLVGDLLYGGGWEGTNNAGTLFRLGTDGSGYTVVHHFTGGSEGAFPVGRVVVSGSTVYGVTGYGGTNDDGTIYRVNTDGSDFAILRRMNRALGDGYGLVSGLVLSGSTLYGVAPRGGANDFGAVYKINTNGSGYQNLRSFTGGADGAQPEAELTLIGSTLYGLSLFTRNGGGGDALFKVGVDGSGFTVLYAFPISFTVLSAARPVLVGNVFYGAGISYQTGDAVSSIYKINTNGTGFQIVGPLPSGYKVSGALAWNGSELLGGATFSDIGTEDVLFQIKTNGSGYKVLRTLSESEGGFPVGDFVAVGSTLYGNTGFNGLSPNSTLFRFDLRPRLAITKAGAGAKLTWPSYAYDYQLATKPHAHVRQLDQCHRHAFRRWHEPEPHVARFTRICGGVSTTQPPVRIARCL